MLRITELHTSATQTTLRLEGAIKGRWVEELRNECAKALDCNGRGSAHVVVLDLAEVSSLDAPGVALIGDLGPRVALKNCSPYLVALLKDVADVEG